MKGVSRRYLLTYVVRVRLGRSIQRLCGRRGVIHIQPDSKDLHDFARLPTPFNRGFEPRGIKKLEKKTTRG